MHNYLFYLILQACLASFFYCLYQRLPIKDRLFQPYSCCDSCNHRLCFLDLIPIISYITLKGRCRYCGNKISIVYFLVESIWVLLHVFLLIVYELNINIVILSVICLDFIVISILDLKYQLIYDSCLWILLLCSSYYMMINLYEHVFAAILANGFIIVCNVLKANSFGGGDIKLCFVLGLMLGNKTMKMMMIAILICGSYCYYLLLFKKANKDMHIAFAPYLCIASMYMLIQ